MKLSAKTLAEDIKKVELSAELQKFYDENVKEMVDLYGEDETIDELINKFVEKANAYLDKNAKKDEPKAEPKAEEKPEYKFKYKPGDKLLYQYNKNDIWPILIKRTGEYDYPTPNQPSYFCEKIGSRVGGEFVVGAEELEKKITGKYEEPKAEKQPKPKFKIGDYVQDVFEIKIGKVISSKYDVGLSMYSYKLQDVNNGELYNRAESLLKDAEYEPKPKKEAKPKAEKQPKPKFKVGDWVKDVTTDKVGGKVLKVEYDKAELVFKYVVLFEDNAKRGGDWYYEYNLVASTEPKKAAVSKAKAEKPKKEAEPKEKKQPEGEPMAKVSPEITIIQRFVRFGHSKKATANTARLILVALQKMIVNKEIRKTSQYADEIMAIQKALLSIVKNGKTDFDRADFERYEKLADTEYQEPVAKLSRSFISLIGRTGVKDKAKNLLEKFEKAEASGDLVDVMTKALKAYINGDTATIEAGARSLQGIFGLAGI